jgi:hypothetical protein
MEIILEFALFCIQILFWTLIVNGLLSLITRHLDRPTKEDYQRLKQQIAKMVHFVREERHGEINYWYDEQTDEFLVQGASTDQLVEQARARFPTHVFIIDDCTHTISGPDWKITPVNELSNKYNV